MKVNTKMPTLTPESGATVLEFAPHASRASTRMMLDLVRRLARRLHARIPSSVPIDDLISAGSEGLVHAMRSFDPSRGVPFLKFARHRIVGAMLDHLQALDPVSRTDRARQRHEATCKRCLRAQLGRDPTDAEIAEAMGLPLVAYRRWSQRPRNATVIPIGIDRAEAVAHEPTDPSPDPEAVLASSSMSARVWAAVEALPPKQRSVLQMYYGREMTLRSVGEALGVSESRACQLKSLATSRLREALESTPFAAAA